MDDTRGARRRCARSVLVSIALIATACGDRGSSGRDVGDRVDDTRGSAAASPRPAADDEVLDRLADAEKALVRRWDELGAFIVAVSALDRGYSPDQLFDAAANDAVAADGSIPSVSPGRSPFGLLAPIPTASAGLRSAIPAGEPTNQYVTFLATSLEEIHQAGQQHLRRLAEEQENAAARAEAGDAEPDDIDVDLRDLAVVTLVLQLTANGYGIDQIVEAILLGDVQVGDLVGCIAIADALAVFEPMLDSCLPPPPDDPTGTPPPDGGTEVDGPATGAPLPGPAPGALARYEGPVRIDPTVAEYLAIESGTIRIDVDADDTVSGAVDIVVTSDIRSVDDVVVCALTARVVFDVAGTAAAVLEGTVTPSGAEVIGTSGPECGVGPNWDTTAEDDFYADIADDEPSPITGTFADGQLVGSVGGFLLFEAILTDLP